MEFELFFPVTELWAIQMYSPLIFKYKGPVVSIEVLATSERLNHQVKLLGGIDLAEQLKTAVLPVSA